jgi:hypothetical protein
VNWILVRAEANAQDMPLWIAQNIPRPKKIIALADLERLLEDQILPLAVFIARGQFRATVEDALTSNFSPLFSKLPYFLWKL